MVTFLGYSYLCVGYSGHKSAQIVPYIAILRCCIDVP